MASVFLDLQDTEVEKIRRLGTQVTFGSDEQIFQEGDEADFMYFVDSGQVSLYIDKFNTKVQIRQAKPRGLVRRARGLQRQPPDRVRHRAPAPRRLLRVSRAGLPHDARGGAGDRDEDPRDRQ